MSEPVTSRPSPVASETQARLAARYRAERRFRAYGVAALCFAGLMLVVLLASVIRPGISGLMRHELRVEVVEPPSSNANAAFDAYTATRTSVLALAPEATENAASRRQVLALVGEFASFALKDGLATASAATQGPQPVWIPLSDRADQYLKGHFGHATPAAERPLNDTQLTLLDRWQAEGRLRARLNPDFFTRGDSRAPEAAGFLGAVVGSLLTLAVCLVIAVPVGIMAAVTLEEFARKTWLAEWLEVVINNLAAVPSIIYGLLGLSIYLQWFGMPRSSPLVGGLTLAMLILPVMIIAARAAIRAVPPSMRQAAAGLGATPLQVVRHHVLPYAMPGILTGMILSIARALGETAPLLMVGMVAFVADIPRGLTDPATAMPVEIYLWASSPEAGFIEKTSSGILVLLVILLLLNGLAVRLRRNMQLTWN